MVPRKLFENERNADMRERVKHHRSLQEDEISLTRSATVTITNVGNSAPDSALRLMSSLENQGTLLLKKLSPYRYGADLILGQKVDSVAGGDRGLQARQPMIDTLQPSLT